MINAALILSIVANVLVIGVWWDHRRHREEPKA